VLSITSQQKFKNKKEMNLKNQREFGLFAKDKGISGLNLHYYNKQIESSLTPYILEERQLNMSQIDVFSRLMMERIIWVSGVVNDNMSTIVQAQLMFLDSNDNVDITMHIDTPGGSVKSGLSMVDVMDYIKSDIRTVNTGTAASMGSILLGAGTKGKRCSLRFSRTMLHQSSGGFQGNIQDAIITMDEWSKLNNILFTLLGDYCNKTPEQVMIDSSRDLWLSAEESLQYGIIDEIILRKQ
jgi:ATP-dependent Clp protease, protease subunit